MYFTNTIVYRVLNCIGRYRVWPLFQSPLCRQSVGPAGVRRYWASAVIVGNCFNASPISRVFSVWRRMKRTEETTQKLSLKPSRSLVRGGYPEPISYNPQELLLLSFFLLSSDEPNERSLRSLFIILREFACTLCVYLYFRFFSSPFALSSLL